MIPVMIGPQYTLPDAEAVEEKTKKIKKNFSVVFCWCSLISLITRFVAIDRETRTKAQNTNYAVTLFTYQLSSNRFT